MLRVLDLFSGIGGFSLGLERTGGFRTVAFCEIEPYCRAVLRKHWPDVPCFEDVRKFAAADVGAIDVICGGYPCQPFSIAGKRIGTGDDRHLWPEYMRLVEALRPSWVIGENVAGHINLGLDGVLSDMESLGYSCRPFVIPACAVDAKHRRDRIWIVAHAGCEGIHERRLPRNAGEDGELTRGMVGDGLPKGFQRQGETMADAGWKRIRDCGCSEDARQEAEDQGLGQERQRIRTDDWTSGSSIGWWPPEPGVGRVAHGIPRRVDRLKALGNAVVPQIPEIIGQAILEAEGLERGR